MAEKILGKDLRFIVGGVELPVISVDFTDAPDLLDGTDTATPGDGKDFETGRVSRTLSVEANLYGPLGTEIITGTLTAGTKYLVTGGTISEDQGDFITGYIFESDGTGTASATNKVKPLGARVKGTDMSLTINSSDVPVTDADFTETYDELDGTDSETTGDGKETIVNRADRESKVTGIMRVGTDISGASYLPATLQIDTDTSIAGYVKRTQRHIIDATTDFAKRDYTLKWRGVPTIANLGLTGGATSSFKIIFKEGLVTDQDITGTLTVTAKNLKSNISSLVTITYTITVNGAITEHAHADA